MALTFTKSFEGFDTDTIKRGEAFYLDLTDTTKPETDGTVAQPVMYGSLPRDYKGKILITQCNPLTFSFIEVGNPSVSTIVDYGRVTSGELVINEMRVLA